MGLDKEPPRNEEVGEGVRGGLDGRPRPPRRGAGRRTRLTANSPCGPDRAGCPSRGGRFFRAPGLPSSFPTVYTQTSHHSVGRSLVMPKEKKPKRGGSDTAR